MSSAKAELSVSQNNERRQLWATATLPRLSKTFAEKATFESKPISEVASFVYAARKRSVDKRRRTSDLLRTSSSKCFEMLAMLTRSNIFVACTREGSTRRIAMIDDGDGVPKHLQRTVFEPRVTSKLDSMHMDKWGVHGRGMALYSIAVNAESATISHRIRASGRIRHSNGS